MSHVNVPRIVDRAPSGMLGLASGLMHRHVPGWLPAVAWIIGVLGSFGIAWALGYWIPMLEWMSTHWFVFLFIAIALMMAAGRIDLGLGIASLFHHDDSRGRGPGSAVGAGFGITLLILESWTIVFLYEYISGFDVVSPNGLDALLPKDLTQLKETQTIFHFLWVMAPPFLVLLMLSGMFPTQIVGLPQRTFGNVVGEGVRYAMGMGLGIGIVALGGLLGTQILQILDLNSLTFLRPQLIFLNEVFQMSSLEKLIPPGQAYKVHATLGIFLIMLTTISLGLAFLKNYLTPSLMVTVHFCGYAAAYFFLISLQGVWRLPLIFVVLVLLTFTNSRAFKYRFPNMGTKPQGAPYYEAGGIVSLDPGDISRDSYRNHPSGIENDPLEAWKQVASARQGRDRPKLVLVCMTGGAYRAGFWSAVVLDRLQDLSVDGQPLRGLTDSIRLLTGASGGMVGAAYFAATRTNDLNAQVPRIAELISHETHGDSLTPILQQLFCRDIPMIFAPTSHQKRDRGIVLDEQWTSLYGENSTFDALRSGEIEGWRPSLVLSPMVVETGRRMLISNLNLGYLTETKSSAGTLYSRSAVEFFKEFAGAYETFRVATGVRMSATFPFASPAVNLPTEPLRRVVDAGYYDNYGVNLAASWAYHHRDWIATETSGLAIIQIQAYQTQGPKLDADLVEDIQPDHSALSRFGEKLVRSFEWLTSPVSGAGSARTWSMSFRNDEQIRQLDDFFNRKQAGMFTSFVFENPVPFGMNWYITGHDIAEMVATIETDGNKLEMDRLTQWWR